MERKKVDVTRRKTIRRLLQLLPKDEIRSIYTLLHFKSPPQEIGRNVLIEDLISQAGDDLLSNSEIREMLTQRTCELIEGIEKFLQLFERKTLLNIFKEHGKTLMKADKMRKKDILSELFSNFSMIEILRSEALKHKKIKAHTKKQEVVKIMKKDFEKFGNEIGKLVESMNKSVYVVEKTNEMIKELQESLKIKEVDTYNFLEAVYEEFTRFGVISPEMLEEIENSLLQRLKVDRKTLMLKSVEAGWDIVKELSNGKIVVRRPI